LLLPSLLLHNQELVHKRFYITAFLFFSLYLILRDKNSKDEWRDTRQLRVLHLQKLIDSFLWNNLSCTKNEVIFLGSMCCMFWSVLFFFLGGGVH
jgi:hypothetical protein